MKYLDDTLFIDVCTYFFQLFCKNNKVLKHIDLYLFAPQGGTREKEVATKSSYFLSMNSCPFLYSDPIFHNGQVLTDIQYISCKDRQLLGREENLF